MGSKIGDNGFDEFPFADTMGALSSAFAACAMIYFTFAAAGSIQDTLENDAEELATFELDQEVAEADAKAKKYGAAYDKVVIWGNVPFLIKMILISSAYLMLSCCYLLVIFGPLCFEDYDLMYTISENLGGDWKNLVLPLGRTALNLFAVSILSLLIFRSWAKSETTKALDLSIPDEEKPLKGSEVKNYV